jgi:hypothetical protein
MSDLMTALVLLARTGGHSAAARVDRCTARRDRGGTWTLRDHDDVEVAEVNVDAGLCLVHTYDDGTQRRAGPRTARVTATEVKCSCGAVHKIVGRAQSGHRLDCSGCGSAAFVVG